MSIRNLNLLRKAAADDRRRAADEMLRRGRRADPARQVRSLLATGAVPANLPPALQAGIAAAVVGPPLRRLLAACVDRSDLVVALGSPYAAAMVALAHWSAHWVRDPAEWRPASHNAGRQFASLARHLLARYPVPAFMDDAWRLPSRDGRTVEQGWFVHLGGGGNLRKADGLPFPLTRMAAHHAVLAPPGTGVRAAVVWGWCRALGAGDRLAAALLSTGAIGDLARAGNRAADRLPFWESVVRFFAAHDRMLDRSQVGPAVDYIEAQKFEPGRAALVDGRAHRPGPPQPGFCMAGRDLTGLLAATEAWHRRLARQADGAALRWAASGVGGFDRVEGVDGHQRVFAVDEILTGGGLRAEGAAMRHCVYSYARRCHGGQAAIFSLTVDRGSGCERRVTVEVDVRSRQVVQARGRHNANPDPADVRVLRAWASHAGLTFGRHAAGVV